MSQDQNFLTNHPKHEGYISWSPAAVFNEAYRRTDGMTFGIAIEAMKKGMKVARAGWNGKGMFLYLVPGTTVPFENLRGPAMEAAILATKIEDGEQGSSRYISSHIDMKDAHGQLVIGWLASQTDMLAEDWLEV